MREPQITPPADRDFLGGRCYRFYPPPLGPAVDGWARQYFDAPRGEDDQAIQVTVEVYEPQGEQTDLQYQASLYGEAGGNPYSLEGYGITDLKADLPGIERRLLAAWSAVLEAGS